MKTLLPPLVLLGLLALPLACSSPDASPHEVAAEPAAPSLPPPAADATAPTPLGAAPDVAVTTLDGQTLRLSDLRGDVVVLNFWATWCAPCVEEIPALITLYEDLNPYGLHVIGVSLDQDAAEDATERIAPFVERFGISYPIALDDNTVADAFGGIFVLPTTYVIDGEGQIVQRFIGLFPVEQLASRLRDMVDAPPVKSS